MNELEKNNFISTLFILTSLIPAMVIITYYLFVFSVYFIVLVKVRILDFRK